MLTAHARQEPRVSGMEFIHKFIDSIDANDENLRYCLLLVTLAPAIWNTLARTQYYTGFLTRLMCGNKYWACYALFVWIFSFSLYRDFVFHQALESGPKFAPINNDKVWMAGAASFGIGSILVGSSMWTLGLTGTYLGDYCGILMDAPVTGFPFNVTADPMYNGATLVFLGYSLMGASSHGLVITIWVFIVYQIALLFESPFTTFIYEQRDKKAGRAKSKPKKVE